MKSKDLNKILIEHFPILKVKYDDEVSWQEGDETGSHVVFGDILSPYMIECVNKDNINELLKIFTFVETMLETDDKYAEEVITLSLFEGTAYFFKDKEYLLSFLGRKSKKLWTKVNSN